MTNLENDLFKNGWVRCPNIPTRWYAGNAGKLQPVFPLELRVTDAIWLVTNSYAHKELNIPLIRFENVNDLEEYLSRNGKPAESGGPNVWD